MTAPTARQLVVLEQMRTMQRERGIPATLRELGAALGIKSTNGIRDHLVALQRRGLVEHHLGCSRGWVAKTEGPLP